MPAAIEAAWAHGRPSATAILRDRAEDFRVEEIPVVMPEGQGEHLWLLARKRGHTSSDLAGVLARHFDVPRRDVGFAGRKDRHADTSQWFSVRLPGREAADPPVLEGVVWEQVSRHARKLATGGLRGNRFRLLLREVAGEREALEQRLAAVSTCGVPNYFGPQRFGRGADNLASAWRMLAEGSSVRRRELRGLLLSAARSWCFNRVASQRVADGSWQQLMPGELAALDGSRSVFVVEDIDEALCARLAAFDVHPSGPLPGRGGKQPAADCAALEAAALEDFAPLIAGLVHARVDASRRALRLRPAEFSWQWPTADSLLLCFELPAGSYATCVVRELVDARDASGAGLSVPA
ncbi:MAG: tRNA pseudouridine(13) synthase TruD [Gammaproteobacteria bacterium]|nr:tRNA pseudouridine(13) synthase TruD [Gammaproteobacteria bacterium]